MIIDWIGIITITMFLTSVLVFNNEMDLDEARLKDFYNCIFIIFLMTICIAKIQKQLLLLF